MPQPTITTATPADEEAVIAVIARAFRADPVTQWAFDQPQQHAAHFPAFVRGFAGRAFEHGSADFIAGYLGAALWLPPGVRSDTAALVPWLRRTLSPAVQPDYFAVLERMERFHPREPHWYLAILGIDPAHQGQGYGSALLRHGLMRCDRDHACAYLESSNPKNIPLYERYGFELQGAIQAGASPPLFPMRRPPRLSPGPVKKD